MAAISNELRTTPWQEYVKDKSDSEERIVCDSLRDWLEALVKCGGPYENADDPRARMLGMRRVTDGLLIQIPLVRVSCRLCWEIEIPSTFVDLLKTPRGRAKLAWVMSVGDHCLEF